MVQFFRNLKHGIHNLIIWFPIIWKIRYWDYEYGVDLFIKYLKHLREGINKYKNHINYEHDLAQIDRFLKMYKFYDELGYFDRYQKEIESLGIPLFASKEKSTPEQLEESRKLFKYYMDKEERLRIILWRYLQQNLANWWD